MKRTLGAFAAVFALFLASSTAALGQARPMLITGTIDTAAGDVVPLKPVPGLARERVVAVNSTVLLQVRKALSLSSKVPVEVGAALFDDVSLVISITGTKLTPRGFEFTGTVEGDSLGSVAIVQTNGIVAGSIRANDHVYQVAGTGGGKYQVQDFDHVGVPDESGAVPEPHPLVAKAIAQNPIPDLLLDDGSTIDLMVVYTAQARAAASPGNTADPGPILAQIDLAVASTNLAYSNSGIVQRVRLVHAEEVTYTDSGDLSVDLQHLSNVSTTTGLPISPDGVLDEVQGLRDAYGADIVSLFVNSGGSAAGLGWLMSSVGSGFAPFGYNVVVWSYAASNLTLAHEMGHNMGLRHDAFMDNGTTPFAYAHGYVDLTHRFRTVMAYDNQCQQTAPDTSCVRIPAFSSPLFSFDGVPQGTAAGADSGRVLNDTRTTVANFRTAVTSPGTLRSGTSASIPTRAWGTFSFRSRGWAEPRARRP